MEKREGKGCWGGGKEQRGCPGQAEGIRGASGGGVRGASVRLGQGLGAQLLHRAWRRSRRGEGEGWLAPWARTPSPFPLGTAHLLQELKVGKGPG